MSEAKFTPGPWEAHFEEYGIDSQIVGGDMRLADVFDIRANAYLIAAAPMLYDALKAIVKYPNPQHNTELWIRAREALAKADGGSG